MNHDPRRPMPPSDDQTPLERLTQQLQHGNAEARASAATALADHLDGPHGWQPLRVALADRDRAVREAATASLDKMVAARPAIVAEMGEYLRDLAGTTPGLSLERLLASVGTPEAVEILFTVVTPGPDERAKVLDLITESKRISNDVLLARLEGDFEEEIVEAAEVLARRGVERGYTMLLDRRFSTTTVDRIIGRGPEAIRVLCGTYDRYDDHGGTVIERVAALRKQTEATVYEIVADPTSKEYLVALAVLGQWDDPKSIETLLRVANDGGRDRYERNEALIALCELEAPEAIEALSEAMLDASVEDGMRCRYARALGQIGNPAALPALEKAQKDPDENLRNEAREAIESIGG